MQTAINTTSETMYCLFAPDGNWQPMTLAADLPTCVAQIRMLHTAKLSLSNHALQLKGFRILPVTVTAIVAEGIDTAFQAR